MTVITRFTLEKDTDGTVIFSDHLVATYGVGTSIQEAFDDYLISALELSDLTKNDLSQVVLTPEMSRKMALLQQIRKTVGKSPPANA